MSKSEYLILFREVFETTRKLSDEQFGILIRAAHNYRFLHQRYVGEDVRVDQAFEALANQIDREQEGRMKKVRAAEKRWEKDAEDCTAMHPDADDAPIHSNPVQSNPDQSIPDQSTNTQKNITKEKISRGYKGAAAPTPGDKKLSFGKFGWVKLSQQEYQALEAELGNQELERCIQYIDESAQSTGNKNRWKDFGLVIQRCSREGWGLKNGKKEVIYGSGDLSEAELWNVRRALQQEEEVEYLYGTVL